MARREGGGREEGGGSGRKRGAAARERAQRPGRRERPAWGGRAGAPDAADRFSVPVMRNVMRALRHAVTTRFLLLEKILGIGERKGEEEEIVTEINSSLLEEDAL